MLFDMHRAGEALTQVLVVTSWIVGMMAQALSEVIETAFESGVFDPSFVFTQRSFCC